MPGYNGGETLEKAEEIITRGSTAPLRWEKAAVPVVIFSARNTGEMDLPACKVFKIIDFWPKGPSHRQIVGKLFHLLEVLDQRKGEGDFLVRS